VVGRNPERTREVARMTEGIPFICDFDNLDAVRELGDILGKRFDRIDAVVNNAGGIVATRQESSQGHELTLAAQRVGVRGSHRTPDTHIAQHPGSGDPHNINGGEVGSD
jgi:short-subunit dehydrogenase involved in D-alanine esterification of teichoic acids